MSLLGYLKSLGAPITVGSTQRSAIEVYALESIHEGDEDFDPPGFSLEGNLLTVLDADRTIQVLINISNTLEEEAEDRRSGASDRKTARVWMESVQALISKVSKKYRGK